MAETDIDIYGGHSQVNPAAVEAETRHHGQVCHRVVPHGGSHRPRGTHSHLGTFVAERRCQGCMRHLPATGEPLYTDYGTGASGKEIRQPDYGGWGGLERI